MSSPALRWFVPCVRYVSAEHKLQMERDGEGKMWEETLPGLGVISTRDIEEGEEIFCNYNFDVDLAPEWYSQVTAG